jgi:hypothetical protein
MRAITITLGASALMAAPAMAQQTARPVAGCVVAALTYKNRMPPEAELPENLDESTAYWRAELHRVQPDPAKQARLFAGAQEALDKDLARLDWMQGMMRVSHFLALCAVERGKREAKP